MNVFCLSLKTSLKTSLKSHFSTPAPNPLFHPWVPFPHRPLVIIGVWTSSSPSLLHLTSDVSPSSVYFRGWREDCEVRGRSRRTTGPDIRSGVTFRLRTDRCPESGVPCLGPFLSDVYWSSDTNTPPGGSPLTGYPQPKIE